MTHEGQGPRWRKTWFAAGLATAVVLILLAVWSFGPRLFREEHASFTSPNGNYRVVVLREPVWRAVMPGQGSDAPGVVRLYDRQGKLLHQTRVEMVSLVEHVEWTADSVEIKLIAEWELPHRR